MPPVNAVPSNPGSRLPIWRVLTVAVLLALILFVVDLGSIGLVDETPPLFAAAARQMAESGDWLIPQVNGLPRYDKPPLVYWLMAAFYRLPAQPLWDPLGSWSAALPSALASGSVVLLLSLLMAWWDRRLWLLAPLLWGLSPLVMVWSRIGVSDALLTALLTGALLFSWLRVACTRWSWWPTWVLLALAVLTKGPVAMAVFALTWSGFLLMHGRPALSMTTWLAKRLRLLPGLLLCSLIALPWYLAVALRDGTAFVESFFGYHNLQRFTQVVNHHHSPWWFYAPLLILASLPWSAALVLAVCRSLIQSAQLARIDSPKSLPQFCSCWLLAVLLLFSLSATKLPSYWLPATPAAALLVATVARHSDPFSRWAIRLGAITTLLMAALLVCSSRWLALVDDPELVGLPAVLDRLWVVPIAVGLLLVGGCLCVLQLGRSPRNAMLAVQLSWLLLVPFVWWPLLRVGDRLRSQPLRAIAAEVTQRHQPDQPLVMLGLIKPSLQFYARVPVAYEGLSAQAQVNLHDRLLRDARVRVADADHRLLVVAPLHLEERRSWSGMLSPLQAQHGRYGLWWLDLQALKRRVTTLQRDEGLRPTWQQPRPERF